MSNMYMFLFLFSPISKTDTQLIHGNDQNVVNEISCNANLQWFKFSHPE